MQTIQLKTEEAANKIFAAMDARMKNEANRSIHTSENKTRAERIKYILEAAYSSEQSFIAYGKKGISVKLRNPAVSNPALLAKAEDMLGNEGVIKKVSPQGIIYHFDV